MDRLDLAVARAAADARRIDACMAGVAAAIAVTVFCLVLAPALAAWWQGAG